MAAFILTTAACNDVVPTAVEKDLEPTVAAESQRSHTLQSRFDFQVQPIGHDASSWSSFPQGRAGVLTVQHEIDTPTSCYGVTGELIPHRSYRNVFTLRVTAKSTGGICTQALASYGNTEGCPTFRAAVTTYRSSTRTRARAGRIRAPGIFR